MRNETKQVGNATVDMFARNGNSGAVVRRNFTLPERLTALDRFHTQYQSGAYYDRFNAEVMHAIINGNTQ